MEAGRQKLTAAAAPVDALAFEILACKVHLAPF